MGAAGIRTRCGEILETPYLELGTHGAKRPKHSALDLEKISAAVPPGPRPWREALEDYLAELKSSSALPAA